MPEPKDNKLYQRAKKYIYKKHPKHSAYRSGLLVQKYKKDFKKKYGNKSPYIGQKTKKKGLKRWFAEKWVNHRGKVGYKYKNDIYRPSKRITRKTPLTHKELSRKEIRRARTRKYKYGRIKKFRKTKRRRRKQRGGMLGMSRRRRSPTFYQPPHSAAAAAAAVPVETVDLEWTAYDFRPRQNNTKKRWRFYNVGDDGNGQEWELRTRLVNDDDETYYGEPKGDDGDAHKINKELYKYLILKRNALVPEYLLLRMALTDNLEQAKAVFNAHLLLQIREQ